MTARISYIRNRRAAQSLHRNNTAEESTTPVYLLTLTTMSGMAHLPPAAPMPDRHFATLAACEAAVAARPVAAAHRLVCLPADIIAPAQNSAV